MARRARARIAANLGKVTASRARARIEEGHHCLAKRVVRARRAKARRARAKEATRGVTPCPANAPSVLLYLWNGLTMPACRIGESSARQQKDKVCLDLQSLSQLHPHLRLHTPVQPCLELEVQEAPASEMRRRTRRVQKLLPPQKGVNLVPRLKGIEYRPSLVAETSSQASAWAARMLSSQSTTAESARCPCMPETLAPTVARRATGRATALRCSRVRQNWALSASQL